MIDTEVMRLRRLRDTALKARALAAALDSGTDRHSSVFTRSAVSCWRISRVITGWLRAHPYARYQRGPSDMRGVYDRLSAAVQSAIAQSGGRSLQTLSRELQLVARGLDDARALTWSSDLSDTFGRSQLQIRALLNELGSDIRDAVPPTRTAVAPRHGTPARLETRTTDGRRDAAGGLAGNWPYLAI
jgi:hypothetical protein